MLEPGDRVWVNVPGEGHVGLGRVAQEPVPVTEFTVEHDGREIPITKADVSGPVLLARYRPAGGSWREAFGEDAEEIFMAWHVGRFVEKVAEAGRHQYDLPMFANAWLINVPAHGPGDYPSGGPVPQVLDVWRCAAPHLDLFAPDIYHPDFRLKCELDVGTFADGRWVAGRRLNGDETGHGTGVLLGDELKCCRFQVHSYG